MCTLRSLCSFVCIICVYDNNALLSLSQIRRINIINFVSLLRIIWQQESQRLILNIKVSSYFIYSSREKCRLKFWLLFLHSLVLLMRINHFLVTLPWRCTYTYSVTVNIFPPILKCLKQVTTINFGVYYSKTRGLVFIPSVREILSDQLQGVSVFFQALEAKSYD